MKYYYIREDNLYKCGANIHKWNNSKDNEFILNLDGNIILFELMNENELKITNQIYFKDVISLKRLNEKSNKFYDDGSKEYFGFYAFFHHEDENKTYSVSIF